MKPSIFRVFACLAFFTFVVPTTPIEARPTSTIEDTLYSTFIEEQESSTLFIQNHIYQSVITSEFVSTYFKASNTGRGDAFGYSIAVSGDTLVVGAPNEDGSSASDRYNTGAVYVFVREGNSWVEQAILHSSNEAYYDYLGSNVAISGDTIVASAQMSGTMTGAVYVFTRIGTTWTQQARIQPDNINSGDNFGCSIDIENDVLVIGASQEDSANMDPYNNSAVNAGAAYIFTRQDNVWTQQTYLKAPIIEKYDYFGSSVAISGSTVVIGSEDNYVSTTGIESIGSAYVFIQEGSDWTLQSILSASNGETDDRFGHSVDIFGDICVVGAFLEDSSSTGVDGDQSNNNAENSGAAYVFRRHGDSWLQEAYLKASNTDAGDWFGYSVKISGYSIVVGGMREDSNAVGVNGNDDDNSAVDSGAVYFFYKDIDWSQKAYIKASNSEQGDNFGGSVEIYNETIFIGAEQEDSNATGVNGDQTNNGLERSGAAYAYPLAVGSITSPTSLSVTGPTDLSITASVDYFLGQSVAQVEFYAKWDGAWHLIGMDTTEPFSMTWFIPDSLNTQLISLRIDVVGSDGTRVEFLGGVIFVIYLQSLGIPEVVENWVTNRVYLNQRSLNPPAGNSMCSSASMTMVLAMEGLIPTEYASLSAKAIEMYPKVLKDGSAYVYLMVNALKKEGASAREYGPLSRDAGWTKIKDQIDSNHSVIIRTRGMTLSGHFIVVVGYQEDGVFRRVIVYDPAGEWKGKTCEELDPSGHSCDNNYFRNSTDPKSDRGKWVYYDFDKIFGSYLIVAPNNQINTLHNLNDEINPPEPISDDPGEEGTFEGFPINIEDFNWLPIILR